MRRRHGGSDRDGLDPRWPELYRQEAARLEAVLGDNLVRMFHMGSTSVPGLRAKPVIDIMGLVWDLKKVEDCRPAFEELGYKVLGELRHSRAAGYMRRGGDGTPRTHHVHLYQFDGQPEHPERHSLSGVSALPPGAGRCLRGAETRLAREFPEDYMGYCRGQGEVCGTALQAGPGLVLEGIPREIEKTVGRSKTP